MALYFKVYPWALSALVFISLYFIFQRVQPTLVSIPSFSNLTITDISDVPVENLRETMLKKSADEVFQFTKFRRRPEVYWLGTNDSSLLFSVASIEGARNQFVIELGRAMGPAGTRTNKFFEERPLSGFFQVVPLENMNQEDYETSKEVLAASLAAMGENLDISVEKDFFIKQVVLPATSTTDSVVYQLSNGPRLDLFFTFLVFLVMLPKLWMEFSSRSFNNQVRGQIR